MQPNAKDSTPSLHPVGNLFTPIKTDADATIEQVTQAVQGLERCQLGKVLALTHLLENGRGDATPIEELVDTLLLRYGYFGGCVTLEDVEDVVETFRANWKSAIEDARAMVLQYPDRFSAVASDISDSAAVPSAESNSAKPVEDTATTEDEPEPQTMTAKMADRAFQDCIGSLESMRQRTLFHQDEEATYIIDDLAGATLLDSILSDWYCGGFDGTLPKENRLLAAIKGNLGL